MNFSSALQKIFIASIIALAASQACMTVQPMDNFDLDRFISRRWYSHQQKNSFNRASIFFCIFQEFSLLNPSNVPFEPLGLQNGYDLKVLNRGMNIDGSIITSDDIFVEGNIPMRNPLCAAQKLFQGDKDSHLTVGFCSLPAVSFRQSNYWVLAYDEDDGMALVSGGQTDVPTQNGLCTFSNPSLGMWIFSRSPVRNEEMILKYRAIAARYGIDPNIMKDVNQIGCFTNWSTNNLAKKGGKKSAKKDVKKGDKKGVKKDTKKGGKKAKKSYTYDYIQKTKKAKKSYTYSDDLNIKKAKKNYTYGYSQS